MRKLSFEVMNGFLKLSCAVSLFEAPLGQDKLHRVAFGSPHSVTRFIPKNGFKLCGYARVRCKHIFQKCCIWVWQLGVPLPSPPRSPTATHTHHICCQFRVGLLENLTCLRGGLFPFLIPSKDCFGLCSIILGSLTYKFGCQIVPS